MLTRLTALSILGLAQPALAASPGRVFYAAPYGSDADPGTLARPFRTVQYALDRADTPGDTVLLRAGTYAEDDMSAPFSGAADAPITLAAYARERAVLTRQTPPKVFQAILAVHDRSYVRIEHLEIGHIACHVPTGNADICYGVLVDGAGTGVQIRGNDFVDYSGVVNSPIWIEGNRSDAPISGIVVDGNLVHDAHLTDSQALSVVDNVRGFSVTNNQIFAVDNIMIDILGQYHDCGAFHFEPAEGVVRGNYVHDAHSRDGRSTIGIYLDVASNVLIDGNTLRRIDQGMDINAEDKCGTPPILPTHHVIVENNRIESGLLWGFIYGGDNPVDDVVVRHNVLIDSPHAAYFDAGHQGAASVAWGHITHGVFVDNLVVGHGHFPITSDLVGQAGPTNVSDYNLFYDDTIPDQEDAKFWWNGVKYTGFAVYQQASGQDRHSVWKAISSK